MEKRKSFLKRKSNSFSSKKLLRTQISSSSIRVPTRSTRVISLHQKSLIGHRSTQPMQLPMKSKEFLKKYPKFLSSYESSELQDYPMVYYLGKKSRRQTADYDDANGDYNIFEKDHIAYRFEIVKVLGYGSFGKVCECFDHKLKELVAVKVIRNNPRYLEQAGVEVKILKLLRKNDAQDRFHIVQMKNYFIFRAHVCIVFELLSINLYEYLQLHRVEGLPLKFIAEVSAQVLKSLEFMRGLSVAHCDLKPENIMLYAQKNLIKVIDFGSSCLEYQKVYSYIQSRFYRAPEIVLGISYTCAIDIWSFGCLLIELYTGFPLFPAENEIDLFSRMVEVFGLPPQYLMTLATRKNIFFNNSEPIMLRNKKGARRIPGGRPIDQCVVCPDKNFLRLIKLCLKWDPSQRISPTEALDHPFFIDKGRVRKTLSMQLLKTFY